MRDLPLPLILLCDANKDARAIYGAIFRHFGASVVEAEHPLDALRIARSEPVTAVVTDLVLLPDGTSLHHALRGFPETKHLAVFVVTDDTHEGRIDDAHRSGAVVRIKPFLPRELTALVLGHAVQH